LSNLLLKIPRESRRIYISIDGPRNAPEAQLVRETISVADKFRGAFGEELVEINISEVNLGCEKGVRSGINWAFETEDRLIILEDDINPAASFFEFCDLALEHHELNHKVWQINGWTPLLGTGKENECYLSDYSHIWGWATWRSRWVKYVDDPKKLKTTFKVDYKNGHFLNHHKNFRRYWLEQLSGIQNGSVDTWDIQWLFTMWANRGKAVSPFERLCGNVGFDSRATHTKFEIRREIIEQPKESVHGVSFNWILEPSSNDFSLEHDLLAFEMQQWGGFKHNLRNYFYRVYRIIKVLRRTVK